MFKCVHTSVQRCKSKNMKQLKTIRSKTLVTVLSILVGIIIPCFFYFFFFDQNDPRFSPPNAVEISNQPLPHSKLLDIGNNIDLSEKVRTGKVLLIYL